jgi:hypothetical protein
VVTDRDRSVVAWVAVIGAVSARDVMARFGVGRTVGYRRLAALIDHGLLARARLVYGQPALYIATADGVAFAGLGELEPAPRQRGVGPALGAVRAPGCGPRAARALRGLGRAAVACRRAAGRRAGCKRPAWHVARRPSAVAPAGSRAVSRYGAAGGGRGRAVGEGRAALAGDLPRVGALPDRLGGSLLRAAACGACRFPGRFGRAGARRHSNPESRGGLEGGH